MSEYNEGDLIEAVKGEDIVRGRLQRDTCAGDLYVHGWCIEPLLRDGFTITIIERAKDGVILPIVPGLYVAGDTADSETYAPLLYWLDKELQWSVLWNHAPAEERTAEQMIAGTRGGVLLRVDVVNK